jgi:hypothetical protein
MLVVTRHVVAILVLPGMVPVLVPALITRGTRGLDSRWRVGWPGVLIPWSAGLALGLVGLFWSWCAPGLNPQERNRVDRADLLIGLGISPVRTPPVG